MTNINEACYLSSPIHKNSLNIELTEDMESNLVLSIDGSIMAIKKSVISNYIDDQDILMIRMGFRKATDELLKYSDEEGLYKFLSCLVDLE